MISNNDVNNEVQDLGEVPGTDISESVQEKARNKGLSFLQGFIKDYLPGICIGLVIALIFGFCFDKARVMSASMEPTLMTDKQYLFVNEQLVPEVKHEQIVEFNFGDYIFCKRIIGLEGDVIRITDGKVYINDEELDDSTYAHGTTIPGRDSVYVVPEGCFFVMGDNRENSSDSRFWDDPYVSMDDLRGVYWKDVFNIQSK